MSTNSINSTAGNETSTALGSLMELLQTGFSSLLDTGSSILNSVLPPERREALKETLTKFATEKPYLASFILSQIAISGFPLFIFIVMTVTVTIFALIAGLLIGLLGALLFILGAIGFALLFLLPTLFFTTFAAVGIWLWGMGVYYIIQKFNQTDVPDVHKPLREGLPKRDGLSGVKSSPEKKAQVPLQTKANGTAH